jgi:hypothetical protein
MSALRALERTLRRWTATVIYELRRTRRVIVAPESRVSCESPVFVLGVHRSGTTLLRLILDSHPNIACPPESFFLAPLAGVAADDKAMEGLTAMGFDREQVMRRLRETASYFFETYAASKGKRRWADKTPSYLDCLGFLEALFGPKSQYVLIFRHGLDVACSIAQMEIREVTPHVRACGGDRFAGAAHYWAAQCEKLLEFQRRLPQRCFELRYEELTTDPEPHLRRMFGFLREPWHPEVLRFHEEPHDHWIGLQDSKAAASRGFRPQTGAWREQPAQVVRAMLREAKPTMEKLGYRTALGDTA